MDAKPEYTALTRRAFPQLLDLFAAGEEVKSLVTHPGWASIMRLLDLAASDLDATLDGRLLDSRAAYAQAHGKRAALMAARDAADAIVAEASRKLREQDRIDEATAEP